MVSVARREEVDGISPMDTDERRITQTKDPNAVVRFDSL